VAREGNEWRKHDNDRYKMVWVLKEAYGWLRKEMVSS
jgi:hypothetical protein